MHHQINITVYIQGNLKQFYNLKLNYLMNNHMKKHTGRYIFSCSVCEFEATREYLLENHKEMKHKNTDCNGNLKCDQCEKTFPALFLSRYHICGQEFTYPCQSCGFIAIDLHEIISHVQENHSPVSRNLLKCNKCDYKTINKEKLNSHQQTNHKNLKVDIEAKDQVEIYCDECEYTCKLNIQLRKHKKSAHIGKENTELRFQCDSCAFASNYVLHMWEHRQANHPQNIPQFFPKSKDMVLALLAEQSYDMIEEIGTLKKNMKESFLELADAIGSSLEIVRNQVEENQNTSKSALDIIADKVEMILTDKNSIKNIVMGNKAKLDDLAKIKDTKEEPKHQKEESKPENKAAEKETKDKGANPIVDDKVIRRKTSKHQVTWVGTSLSKVLNQKKLEQDLDVELTAVKAYCVEEEGRFPEANFKAIVPKTLQNGQVDTLVLETGSIEITNINVNKAMMNTDKHIEDLKKEWFEKAENTSKALFELAEDSVANEPGLNVIILKRPQRFDKGSEDILGIKPKISEFANKVYDQCLLKSSYHKRIHVVELNLIQNSSYLKEIIYGNPENPRYDGIHLSGSESSRHFTYRVIQSIGPILSKPNAQKLPRFSHHGRTNHVLPARRKNYNYQPGPVDQSKSEDHENCPQSNYQRKRTNQKQRNINQSEQTKTYSSAVKSGGHYDYDYSVPTSNLYNHLN